MKGYKFYFTVIIATLLLMLQGARAQSPGGLSANNTLWLRSDTGLTVSGTSVTDWAEISGAGVTGDFVVVPFLPGNGTQQTSPTIVQAGINFNPFIRFDGVTNSLGSSNAFSGDQLVDNVGGTVTVFQVINLKGGTVWLKWESDGGGQVARLGFEHNPTNNSVRFDFPSAISPTGVSWGQDVGVTNILNKDILSTCYADSDSSYNRLTGALDNKISLSGVTGDFSQDTHIMTIGNNYSFDDPAQIDIAEEIVYARELPFSERNKIESYLAVKYGITLNQAAANNNYYTATNDSIVWNRARNSTYANNITGIGRDDATKLIQMQSKSINTGATGGLVTIYNGNNYTGGVFPTTNAANKNGFASDLSYILFGDNALATTLTACGDSNKVAHMARVWKVEKYGNVGAVTLSVDQTAVPATIKSLLVSSDSTFRTGVQLYSLTAANGKLYTSLNLSSNQFFTFGGSPLSVALNIVQPSCSSLADTVTTIVTGGAAPITYAWTPLGFITPTIHNVAAGNYTVIVKQAGGCADTIPFTIATVSNLPAPVFGPIAPICKGGATSISILNQQTGASYNWYDSATGGKLLQKDSLTVDSSFTTPVLDTTTTYYLQITSTCSSTIRTPVSVVVNQPKTSTVIAQTCPQNSYLFNGKLYDSTGTYKDTLKTALGCDSIAILQLTVTTSKTSTVIAQTCPQNSYLFNGKLYDSTGTYKDTLKTALGCDSIVTLQLTVTKPPTSTTTPPPICSSSSYLFNGKFYSATGVYYDTVKTLAGCDSIAILQLTVSKPIINNTVASFCSGDSLIYNGTVIKTANTYTFHFLSSAKCDSTVNLVVTVNPKKVPSFTPIASICTGANAPTLPTTSLEGVSGTWSPATVSNTQTGTYTFTPSTGQCDTSTAITIIVDSNATVSPIEITTTTTNNTVSVGNNIDLTDSVAGGVWSVDSTTIAIINASGVLTGKSIGIANVYYVVNGICGPDTVSLKVSVIKTPNIFIPNLFTPTAATNNIFYVRGTSDELKAVDLHVFDSWGGELFSSGNNPLKGWDGTYNGKLQPTGVYIYVARITPSSGVSYIKKGSITLIR